LGPADSVEVHNLREALAADQRQLFLPVNDN
jgi:hypothetical protein